MIGKLKGKVDSIYDDHFILDVEGVGYLVYSSSKTLGKLSLGEYFEVLIQTHVREDHIHLYGFYNIEEKTSFSMLQSVKGVGTRMALAILSHLTPQQIEMALATRDKEAFNGVSGVGKKLAERIITELKDKFALSDLDLSSSNTSSLPKNTSNANDAVLALVNLGVSRIDAYNRVNSILSSNADMPINELIKTALQKHSKGVS
ncbi:Holliday junction branch migration protein RuvA [Rickettsiaceae bacterium]|nr:Holliday junction branch migration protein RuvA [Rickettsiaceae bacterium]